MKILTIVGARPQFIKSSVFSKKNIELKAFKEVILHTGQHFDKNMSDIFFDQLSIPKPKYNLNINSKSHAQMTGEMMIEIEKILKIEFPDGIIVYGDTNSTLAGALAAKKIHIPVFHIESGLRSYNIKMPEEINRILTDNLSDILFCSSNAAVDTLIKEGFQSKNCKIFNVGDIMNESVFEFSKSIKNKSSFDFEYCLLTLHRPENTENKYKLDKIFKSLNLISEKCKIVMPIHPRTKMALKKFDIKLSQNIILIESQGYLEMLNLIKNSKIILTDSGGLQKEAYFMGKYCITLRSETEWIELVENKVNFVVGCNEDLIIEKFEFCFNKSESFKKLIYGDHNVSEKIIKHLKEYYI